MKHLSLFTILSAILLSSCEQKSFTNEFSGTIWEGVEISREWWDDYMDWPSDTSYHRLEFLDFTDDAVQHYYWSDIQSDWRYRGMFHYSKTSGGSIRMEWEVAYYGDTLTRWFDVSDDMMSMTAVGDFYKIRLKQIK